MFRLCIFHIVERVQTSAAASRLQSCTRAVHHEYRRYVNKKMHKTEAGKILFSTLRIHVYMRAYLQLLVNLLLDRSAHLRRVDSHYSRPRLRLLHPANPRRPQSLLLLLLASEKRLATVTSASITLL